MPTKATATKISIGARAPSQARKRGESINARNATNTTKLISRIMGDFDRLECFAAQQESLCTELPSVAAGLRRGQIRTDHSRSHSTRLNRARVAVVVAGVQQDAWGRDTALPIYPVT
jgi:hypothetical protein